MSECQASPLGEPQVRSYQTSDWEESSSRTDLEMGKP